MKRLLEATLRHIVHPLLIPSTSRALQERSRAIDTVDQAAEVAFGFDHHGVTIAPWQSRREITELLRLLEETPPRVVLEIGTATGGTLYLFSRVAAPDALLVSLDLRHGPFGGGYPVWRKPLYRSFATRRQRVELVGGDSHAPATLEAIRRLGAEPIDLLFIDGDHTYAGVKADFEMYSPLVAPDGIIALHDIVPAANDTDSCRGTDDPGHSYRVGDVPQFWAELRARTPVREFVENWDQGSFGIGVIRKRDLET